MTQSPHFYPFSPSRIIASCIAFIVPTDEFQPGLARVGFEMLAGFEDHPKAAPLQFFPNPNKWVAITGTSDRTKQDCFMAINR